MNTSNERRRERSYRNDERDFQSPYSRSRNFPTRDDYYYTEDRVRSFSHPSRHDDHYGYADRSDNSGRSRRYEEDRHDNRTGRNNDRENYSPRSRHTGRYEYESRNAGPFGGEERRQYMNQSGRPAYEREQRGYDENTSGSGNRWGYNSNYRGGGRNDDGFRYGRNPQSRESTENRDYRRTNSGYGREEREYGRDFRNR